MVLKTKMFVVNMFSYRAKTQAEEISFSKKVPFLTSLF